MDVVTKSASSLVMSESSVLSNNLRNLKSKSGLPYFFFHLHRIRGFFYRNQYIGTEPGNLFAATTCCCLGEDPPAQPLVNEEEEIRYDHPLQSKFTFSSTCSSDSPFIRLFVHRPVVLITD